MADKIDHLHSYYLHPSDSLSMTLVYSAFDGTRYCSWKKLVLISLSTKNKLGFIDAIEKPAQKKDHYNLWVRCNDIVFAGC